LKKNRNTFLILLLSITGLTLRLIIPSFGTIHSLADDQLFVEYSEQINSGNWLGGWSRYTLLKVPGYAVFLSFSKLLNLNPIIITYVVYMFGAIFLAKIVTHEILKKPNLFALFYLLLIFNPSLYGAAGSLVYRTTLVQALIPIVIYLVLRLFLKLDISNSRISSGIYLRVLVLGFILGLLKVIREDVIWIVLPSLLLILYAMFHWLLRMNHKSKSFVKIVLISSLIFISYNLPIYTIKLINYEKYGVFLTNDFSEGYFAVFSM
jgi:hypothetical protein